MLDLRQALTEKGGDPFARRKFVREAVTQGASLSAPQLLPLWASAVEDPYLGEIVAIDVAPRLGAQFAQLLHAQLHPDGDLPDLFRLHVIFTIFKGRAVDVLAHTLEVGSALLREYVLEVVARRLPGTASLESQCVEFLSPMTNMRLEDYMCGHLFSMYHGKRCAAAIEILKRTPRSAGPMPMIARPESFEAPRPRDLTPPPPLTPRKFVRDRLDLETSKRLQKKLQAGVSDHVRFYEIVVALGRTGDEGVVPLLLKCLNGGVLDKLEPPTVHSHNLLIEAILRAGGESAVAPLIKSLAAARPNTFALYALIDALCAVGGDAVIAALSGKLRQFASHSTEGSYLVAMLARLSARDALRDALKFSSLLDSTRDDIIKALNDPKKEPAVMQLLNDLQAANHVEQRLTLIAELGRHSHPDARAPLQKELQDPLYARIFPATIGEIFHAALEQALR